MTHGYPIGVGEPEPTKGPLGAGRWSDIMAAPLDEDPEPLDEEDQPTDDR